MTNNENTPMPKYTTPVEKWSSNGPVTARSKICTRLIIIFNADRLVALFAEENSSLTYLSKVIDRAVELMVMVKSSNVPSAGNGMGANNAENKIIPGKNRNIFLRVI